jgi:hypothetical protein
MPAYESKNNHADPIMRHFYPPILAALLLFTGCNKADPARKQFDQARNLYETAQYGAARQSLSELKTQYPQNLTLQKDILRLTREIEWKEQHRNLAFCDSLLPIRRQEADALKPSFTFEKTGYDAEGRYIDPAWNPSLESGSIGIKTSVTEANDLVLTAIHKGSAPTRYNRIKVSLPSGEYAETQAIPSDGGANYSFTDINGTCYEILTFQKGRDQGVIAFIYAYADEKISMEYLGGKKIPPRLLSSKEKNALVSAVRLASLLKEIAQLSDQKEKAEQRIVYLRSKL